MVGESFHPRGCWGEDSDHIRLGATVQKLLRLFAFGSLAYRSQIQEILEASAVSDFTNQGNSRVIRVIEAREGNWKIIFQKVLDRIAGPTLYKMAARSRELRTVKETFQC